MKICVYWEYFYELFWIMKVMCVMRMKLWYFGVKLSYYLNRDCYFYLVRIVIGVDVLKKVCVYSGKKEK